MFFRLLRNLVAGFFTIAVWALVALAGVPLTLLFLFLILFPDFTYDGGLWFWLAFIVLNVIGFYSLWKPIVWTVSTIKSLGEGISGKKQPGFRN